MVYWFPDRQAWVRDHPSLGAGYGDGIVMARAVISSTGPALLALLALLLPPPRLRVVLLLGFLAGMLGFILQRVFGDSIFHAFGFRAAVHVPTSVAAAIVVAAYIAGVSLGRARATPPAV
jgi:hypothetical protein